MDDEMEEVVPEAEVFDRFEVDLDYEFDAPKFFDLGREETLAEARKVELWFESARSYPPSPLISKLIFEKDIQIANIITTSNLEDLEIKILHTEAFVAEVTMVSDTDRGCTYHSYEAQGVSEVDHKPACKKPLSKRSTLMKPTASQLAKQNRPGEVKPMRQFRNQLECRKEKGSIDVNDYTDQAAKRQRLETGHCYKVIGSKHQVDLFHKGSEKHHFLDTKRSGLADTSNRVPRLKLTIPREPELKTARRALSLRTQQQKPDDSKCRVEGMPPSFSTFKALPLNRKILEAPSLPLPQKTTPSLPKFKEFNFRTHDRALAHNTSASSMNSDSHNPTVTGGATSSIQIQPHENVEGKHIPVRFKAQALNPKILASKGVIGVYRCAKRESTKPKEFNLSTAKRFQQSPLTELFNELSMTCEAQQSNIHHKVRLRNGLAVEVLIDLTFLFELNIFPSSFAN
ncbi:protein TPX2-like isoform X1 [Zingiber officinale]|uniref:protein TPX2-like isoform X1 n=1 Tax=Zingiber officinale TaxID=94328 RepID=UPI001C4B15A1|nr:protein TPX2-like isoform X1 [Zingiber officinale]XP_042396242.1 protein TPX2-like isoform X1 [Zingiber officinale]